MEELFPFADFVKRFPDDVACLEEIKRLQYPHGIRCLTCKKKTPHYPVQGRTAYACQICRTHTYPLAGTLFEKSSTPLRLWFYALFLMTQTKATISITQLQKELGVTYKTAWRMYTLLHKKMRLHNGDLLPRPTEKVHKWVFLNAIEFKVVQKEEVPRE